MHVMGNNDEAGRLHRVIESEVLMRVWMFIVLNGTFRLASEAIEATVLLKNW